MDEAITFDDVLIKPQKSFVESRSEVDTSMKIVHWNISVPILSANMESVTNADTIIKLFKNGANGVLHRFKDKTGERRIRELQKLSEARVSPRMVAVGIKEDFEVIRNIAPFADILFLDVAYAYSEQFIKFLKEKIMPMRLSFGIRVIVGNIATADAARVFKKIGVDGIKVGVGSGSACSTRIKTGVGVPQLSAVMEVYNEIKDTNITLISDGGINTCGDVAKAIVAGADLVMTGKHIALCSDNTASDFGEKKVYYGSASEIDKAEYIEGESALFDDKSLPSIEEKIKDFKQSLQSSISYAGGKNLRDIKGTQIFMRISNNTINENKTRLGD